MIGRCAYAGGPIYSVFHEDFQEKVFNAINIWEELLALVSTVSKLRPYSLDQTFKVKIDQQALKYFLGQEVGTETQ